MNLELLSTAKVGNSSDQVADAAFGFPARSPTDTATFEVVTCPCWTLIRCSGRLTRSSLVAVVRLHFPRLVAKNLIWDFSAATMAGMMRADFEAIAEAVKLHGNTRRDAKTAFVGPSPEAFALSCIYVGLTGLAEVPVEYSVFRTVDDAGRWMGGACPLFCETPCPAGRE